MLPVINSSFSLVENLSFQENPLQDLVSSLESSLNTVISTNESTRLITGPWSITWLILILQTTTTLYKYSIFLFFCSVCWFSYAVDRENDNVITIYRTELCLEFSRNKLEKPK